MTRIPARYPYKGLIPAMLTLDRASMKVEDWDKAKEYVVHWRTQKEKTIWLTEKFSAFMDIDARLLKGVKAQLAESLS